MKRGSAHVLSRSSAGAAVPFSLAALSADLQRDIGSYLEAKAAVHGIGLASKECRAAFLAGVGSALHVSSKLLQGRQPTAAEEDDHASSLTRLLRSMPALTRIDISSASLHGPTRILGQALCRLESPMDKVTKLSLDRRSVNDARPPHPIVQALAEGRLPGLEVLDVDSKYLDFLDQPANARLLQQAIQGGHLSQLKVLGMRVGPALDAALQGFRGMSQETQQRQAPLESLTMQGAEEVELDEESLKAALRTPCLSRREFISCDSRMFDAVADYVGKDGDRPFLRSLDFDLISAWEVDVDLLKIESLMNALAAEGAGALNLDFVHFVCANESTFVALGAVYAAGGMTKLSTLSFSEVEFSETGVRSLFDAVGMTLHKGEALTKIEIVAVVNDDEEGDTMEERIRAFEDQLKAAQARGIFPNAQVTSFYYESMEMGDGNAEAEEAEEE